jgi:cystinosin
MTTPLANAPSPQADEEVDETIAVAVNEESGLVVGQEQQQQQQQHRVPSSRFTTPTTTVAQRLVNYCPRRIVTTRMLASPFLDETGSARSVVLGLSLLFLVGSLLGLVLPKNGTLPNTSRDWYYGTFSSIMGYTYFICWSVSFYPQVMTNYRQQHTRGLSADFCGLNVLGFACYTIYNVAFYTSPTIQQLYRERTKGGEVTIQSNDVAFAVHALLLSSITLGQIAWYDGLFVTTTHPQQQRFSKVIVWIAVGMLSLCLIYPCLVVLIPLLVAGGVGGDEDDEEKASKVVFFFNWLDYLYLLSYIKIAISLIKYIPQVRLNYSRKSTCGWSIWNIVLDFTGGFLSALQLVLDCAALQDWWAITGNVAKFALGFCSMFFDVIFMVQHYVLYDGRGSITTAGEGGTGMGDSLLVAGGGDDDPPNLHQPLLSLSGMVGLRDRRNDNVHNNRLTV